MRKRKIQGFLCLLVAACLSLCPLCVSASEYSDQTQVNKNVRVGAVDIELHQTFPQDQTMIVPGQTVSLESFVENKGKPAWIRVKMEYPAAQTADGKAGAKVLDDTLVQFEAEGWKRIGDYHYYTKPVESGAKIPFTKSITFPTDWDNSSVSMKMGVAFTAEGVQEKNFTPDFTSDDPWHGAVIEGFHADDYETDSDEYERFTVSYKNGVEGLLHLNEDFFDYQGDLMPGDERTGTATITNHMNIPVRVFFEMKNKGNEKLLEAIRITIVNGKDTVYDGPLSGTISPAELLYTYQPGDETTFRYYLTMPSDLDNDYALTDFHVDWVFSAEEIILEEPVKEIMEKVVEIVKTGDVGFLTAVGVLLGLMVMAGSLMILKKRKRGGPHA